MDDNNSTQPKSGENTAQSTNTGNSANPEPRDSGAKIISAPGDIDTKQVLQKAGEIKAEQIEPTDQSFIFANPGENGATFVADDTTLMSPAALSPSPAALAPAHQAMNVMGEHDPAISWRGLSEAHISDPLSAGVIKNHAAPSAPRDIYSTEPGLFSTSDFFEEDGQEANYELVLGVKFRQYGSVYFFRAGNEKIKTGGKVLVETEQGLSLGNVVSASKMRLPLPKIQTAEGDELEIKPIIGLASPADIAAAADNNILASSARMFCKECIRERSLDMKLVDVEVLHDRSKIIFYFTAPTRIDFRELVKDLVRTYRTRIELRQIGVRHETQMLGALGNCGMACCCRRYLRRFAPVTIKMAKEQNLFLNPAKLSGICGRLLCCLANEQENYEEFHKNSPKLGKRYQTSIGQMKVVRANLFRQSIMAVNEAGEEFEYQLDEWHELAPVRLEGKSDPVHSKGEEPAYEQSHDSAELASLLDGDDELNGRQKGRERTGKHAPRNNRGHNGEQNDRREGRNGRQPHGNREQRDNREPRAERRQHNGYAERGDQPENSGQHERRHDKNHRKPGHNHSQNGERMPREPEKTNDSATSAANEEPARHQQMQGDISRLKDAMQNSNNRGDDDNSIFGLPGSKFK